MSAVRQLTRDITSINCWPPGAIMIFDSRDLERDEQHLGFGLAVANDKHGKIWVLWDAGCGRMFCEYDVRKLNPQVIHRG